MVSPHVARPAAEGATGRGETAAPSAPYLRVKQHLKDGLADGRWPPGALMPSEAELVTQFGVSRMTVSRALRELQAEGLVDRSQGVGTFAAQLHRVSSTLTIRDLHEEIESRGHRH
ncbi:MAG: GntR family transcriptional regulator, partial [Rubrivivax sp.]|nr:GntR family transcriptional regulator [Rubrivivax sp.]